MAAALFESFGCETTRPASGGGLTYLERMTEDLEDDAGAATLPMTRARWQATRSRRLLTWRTGTGIRP